MSCALIAYEKSFAQEVTTIVGTVAEKNNNSPLVGMNVLVKGKMIGTTTDPDGKFTLKTSLQPPFTLVISGVGFLAQEVEITSKDQVVDIRLEEQEILGQEVVVSASRVEENIMKSPVSVEKVDIVSVKQNPAISFYDGLQNLRGIDFATSSLTYRSINTRGFNQVNNVRFVTLVDGVDQMAPSLNLTLGNISGPNDLDVESVELIPGAASALYGSQAINGVLNTTTKSPFLYQGLSAQAKMGVNHLDRRDRNPALFQEYAIRYAKLIGSKFAFKVGGSYQSGQDWQANQTTLFRNENRPVVDYLNIYGDEISLGVIGGRDITRTGYAERDLADYRINNFRIFGSAHYRLSENVEASYGYRLGAGNTVYTGLQRYQLKNFTLQQHRLELKGANFFLRQWATLENSGDTYDMGQTAQLIEERWKSNTVWLQEYIAAYNGLVPGVQGANHTAARAFADRGRPLPGSSQFEQLFEQVTTTDIGFRQNQAGGSRFNVSSNLYTTEGMYDFSKYTSKIADIMIGGSYRFFDLNSNGTIFPDSAGNDITMYEYGLYTQISRKITNNLKLTGAMRYDKSEQIDRARLTPRIAAVYTIKEKHNIRASYQTGFRMPTTQEQFINLNLGFVHLLGGLEPIYNSQLAGSNLYTLESVQKFGVAASQQIAQGTDALQAINNTRGLLKPVSSLEKLRPEGVKTFELGYKGLFDQDRILLDASAFYSIYTDFIAPFVMVAVPANASVDPLGAGQSILRGNRKVYAVYQNADKDVNAYGASVGMTYSLRSGYVVGGNYTYADIDFNELESELIQGFNTPRHKANITFGNRNLYKNVGFNITWRWTDAFAWKSSFSEGIVPSMNVFDAQVSYRLESLKSILRVGGMNVFNQRYTQLYGGPVVGALYYISITYDQFGK
ncbi:MAG: TonB-dependent receptor [Cytophagales bacterium]|nr:TonB-dependent receptor [Cytophagales bacterium]MDW8384318.1 TonB-dependent receptor [Flammeovirgaceae bacterium]